jgi:hypothetical protein
MIKISNFLDHISNWKSLLIFMVLLIIFNGYIFKKSEQRINELAGTPIELIDVTIGFNPQKTLNMVTEYGETARHYYTIIEMTADAVYPIVYAFLFIIILTILYRNKSYAWINRLPFITVLFDYIENINIIVLLKTFPQQSVLIATLCEIFKLLKWISLCILILLVIFGLIVRLFNRNKLSS